MLPYNGRSWQTLVDALQDVAGIVTVLAGAVAAVAGAITAIFEARRRLRDREKKPPASGPSLQPSSRRTLQRSLIGVLGGVFLLAVGFTIWNPFRTPPPPPPDTPTTTETTTDQPVTTTSSETPTTISGQSILRDCPTMIEFGKTVRRSIGQASQVDCFSFAGASEDRVWANVAPTSGNLDPAVEVIRPDRNRLACGGVTNPSLCVLDASGIHAIFIKSFRGTSTGGYHLYLQRLNQPDNCGSLAHSPVRGSVSARESVHCYRFSGSQDDRVSINVVVTSGNLDPSLEITRPDGDKLPCGGVFNPRICALDDDGKHTILIRSFSGRGTGGYSITLA